MPSEDGNSAFAITDTKLYVPIVTLSAEGIVKLSLNDLIKQYDEVRKVSTGKEDDYTTGCLLDFAYYEKNYKLIAADLSKQKAWDADSRAIQSIIFTGTVSAAVIIYYILEQSKETILEFSKGTTKVF